MARIGVEGQVEPHPQRALLRGGHVRVHVGGFDPRVLHPRDTAGQVVVGGGRKRPDPHGFVPCGHHRGNEIGCAPFTQRAQRGSVGPARDLPHHRIGRVRGDTGALQRRRVHPERVIVPRPQHHRAVRYHSVEPACVEQTVGREAAVVGRADDPLLLGVGVGVLLDRGDDLVDRFALAHRGTGGFEATVERVGVAVAERRHEEPAFEIHLDIGGSGLGRVADGLHDAARDQQGVGGRVPVRTPDHAVAEDGG